MLVFDKAWQYDMNFGKLLHNFCVMHYLGICLFLMVFENKNSHGFSSRYCLRPEDTIFMAAGLKDAAGLGFMVMVLQVLMTAISIPLMELWRDSRCKEDCCTKRRHDIFCL